MRWKPRAEGGGALAPEHRRTHVRRARWKTLLRSRKPPQKRSQKALWSTRRKTLWKTRRKTPRKTLGRL